MTKIANQSNQLQASGDVPPLSDGILCKVAAAFGPAWRLVRLPAYVSLLVAGIWSIIFGWSDLQLNDYELQAVSEHALWWFGYLPVPPREFLVAVLVAGVFATYRGAIETSRYLDWVIDVWDKIGKEHPTRLSVIVWHTVAWTAFLSGVGFLLFAVTTFTQALDDFLIVHGLSRFQLLPSRGYIHLYNWVEFLVWSVILLCIAGFGFALSLDSWRVYKYWYRTGIHVW